MKNKVLLIVALIVVLGIGLFVLTGCGNKTASENNNIEQSVVQNSEEEINPDVKIANNWMKLPKNVNMYWKTDVKGTNNYETKTDYKRDNDVMSYVEGLEDGVYVTQNKNGIGNEYYFYHYQGDYKWTSYCHFKDKGWDNWYFKGNYPSSPQCYCFGKPWNILNNYSNNHETIEIEGVGTVDTVTGTDDEGYTYYYSKDLGFNVKIENNVQTWYLFKFDTNVSGFPHSLPDMKTLDAKEASYTSDITNVENNSQKVIEGEDGELIIYDK